MVSIPTVEQVAELLLRAPDQAPWANEGPCRTMIRRALCLGGSAWAAADEQARRLVERGRQRAGIRKPAGWDANILPALDFAMDWRECPIDGRPFKPRQEDHVYCSPACQQRARKIGIVAAAFTRCGKCGGPIEEPAPGRKYCSLKCQREADWQRENACRRLARAERLGIDTLARVCALEGCDNPIPDEANLQIKFCSPACATKDTIRRQQQRARDDPDYRQRKAEQNRLHHEERRLARAKQLGIDLDNRVCARDGCDTPIPREASLLKEFCSRRCARMATYHNKQKHDASNPAEPARRPDDDEAAGDPGRACPRAA